MTKDEVKKLRMNSPESLQFLNNATKFYNLMMMYSAKAIIEADNEMQRIKDKIGMFHEI